MKTNSMQNTGRAPASVRPSRLKQCGTVLAAASLIAGTLVPARTALADPTGLDIIPLAQGFSTQHEIHIQAKGPNDVLQARLVFNPGGDTGWHTHPGPVIVVVKSGALTEIHKNGCVSVHPAGSVFFESAGEVHRAINQTGNVTEVYATFISPAGAPPLQPTGDPGETCRDRD
jgi:quercetin dioxygenase-like cupin family protein